MQNVLVCQKFTVQCEINAHSRIAVRNDVHNPPVPPQINIATHAFAHLRKCAFFSLAGIDPLAL